ncbi:MAG: hypothetical protein WD850_00840 [Candidatus Spechtbacterales bacterium]
MVHAEYNASGVPQFEKEAIGFILGPFIIAYYAVRASIAWGAALAGIAQLLFYPVDRKEADDV